MKNALRTRFGTWDRTAITENCEEVVIIIMRLDAIISRLLYRLLSSQNIRFGFIRTHVQTNQQLIIYAKRTNACLFGKQYSSIHFLIYVTVSQTPATFQLFLIVLDLKKKEPKKIYLKLFFFFYLEEFYNQFSLRIINKLFWRGTITWTIRVETHVKYLKLVPIKIRTSMMKFHLQFDHQPPCTVC